jgi:hypothetical protein
MGIAHIAGIAIFSVVIVCVAARIARGWYLNQIGRHRCEAWYQGFESCARMWKDPRWR